MKHSRLFRSRRDQNAKTAASPATQRRKVGQNRRTDLRLRSPLLAPLLQTNGRHRAWRVVLVALLAFATWLLIDAVANRRVTESSPFHILYWLHDHVFLPVKGYIYTYHFPVSLVWWGLVATALALGLSSFLTDRSAVRFLHVHLVRLVIRQPSLHIILVTTARWFARWGLEPDMLKAVVEHEWTLAVNRLAASLPSQAGRAICTEVKHLTELSIRLHTLPGSNTAEQLKATALWHQAFLQVRVHGDGRADWYRKLLPHLAGDVNSVADLMLNQDRDQLKKALAQPAGFDPVTVMIDLLYLASLNNLDVAERLNIADTSVEERRQLVHGRLAESVEARRAMLDKALSQLEMLALRSRLVPTAGDIEGAVRISPENPSAIGQLSLGIALDLAERANAPEIAWGYVDSADALDFALGLVERGLNLSGTTSDLVNWLDALIGDVRYLERYRLCARVAELQFFERKKEWKHAPPIDETDGLALTGVRIESLYHAAGPE